VRFEVLTAANVKIIIVYQRVHGLTRFKDVSEVLAASRSQVSLP
jgi:hypothetical protein